MAHRPLAPQPRPQSPPPSARPAPRPFTVGEVLAQVRSCLDDNFRPLVVRGEVTNKRRPRGGHLYLTLRDSGAKLKVVVFAGTLQERAAEGGFPIADIQDGDEVVVWGRITAYPASGDIQVVAEAVEPVGEGAWRARRERVYKALRAEGLFDPDRKQAPPFLPLSIGVVTSATGAAIRDVLSTLERRFCGVRVVVAPVRVNGLAAAPAIAHALRDMDRHAGVELILLVRGGGGQEDLAAFDEELVVRAVAACRTPLITGVGHETDVTLADLAADRRAPTPTGAAELALPERAHLEACLEERAGRLQGAIRRRLLVLNRLPEARRRLALCAPDKLLARRREELAVLAGRLQRAHPRVRLAAHREALEVAARRLALHDPRPGLVARRAQLDERAERLARAVRVLLRGHGERLAGAAGRLASLSPLEVLARGYSLTTRDGAVVHDAAALAPGDTIHTRLARGELTARVIEVRPRAEKEGEA
jgi:exodeoxyribonuclease VII large subunit